MSLIISSLILAILSALGALGFRYFFLVKPVPVSELHEGLSSFDIALAKKYDAVDIHRQRKFAIITGLFITCIFAVVLVEYISKEVIVDEKKIDVSQAIDETIEVKITEIKPPPPPKLEITFVPVEVDDEELIDEEEEEEEPELEEEEDDWEEEIIEPEPEPEKEVKIYEVAEIDPVFPGGEEAFMNFINTNLAKVVTDDDVEDGGLIIVKFVVNPDGSLSNFSIIEGINSSIDQKVISIINSSPRWSPAKIEGQRIPVYYEWPVEILVE